METTINEKRQELKVLMCEVEQNLLLLEKEDFDNVVEEYVNIKKDYMELLSNCNEINPSLILSLESLISEYKTFNDSICGNYNLGNRVCYAA